GGFARQRGGNGRRHTGALVETVQDDARDEALPITPIARKRAPIAKTSQVPVNAMVQGETVASVAII
ncbi:hypothetical protein ABQF04_05105, partial [Xanthomonas campestris pv. campestris]|uniref:hypothetical protein n=1 Tax=Xanthomonas campestris TaxID=339 RepID=UPI0032E3D64A